MIVTIVYGLACLFSGDISVDYNVLIGTIFLDCMAMGFGTLMKRK
jgi:hypothetical protein